MADPFALPDGSRTGVLGVVMHVGPYEIDFLGPSGIREVAVVDTSHNIIFLRIFGQSADDYGNTLLLAELNGAVLMARDMKVDQKSRSLDSIDSTTIMIETYPTSPQFCLLDGVRAHVRMDMTIREHVKRLVMYRRDIYEGHVDPTQEPTYKKRKFGEGTSRTNIMDELD